MTNTTHTHHNDRPSFADSPMFGIDLSGASADLRADTHRATMTTGPAPTTTTDRNAR